MRLRINPFYITIYSTCKSQKCSILGALFPKGRLYYNNIPGKIIMSISLVIIEKTGTLFPVGFPLNTFYECIKGRLIK